MTLVAQEIYKESKKRKPSQKDNILLALRLAGKDGLTNVELKDIAVRFSARTNELQLDGYDIELFNEGGGVVRYILHSPHPIREKTVIKSGFQLWREHTDNCYYGHEADDVFNELVSFLNENNLHIKYKPDGIRK